MIEERRNNKIRQFFKNEVKKLPQNRQRILENIIHIERIDRKNQPNSWRLTHSNGYNSYRFILESGSSKESDIAREMAIYPEHYLTYINLELIDGLENSDFLCNYLDLFCDMSEIIVEIPEYESGFYDKKYRTLNFVTFFDLDNYSDWTNVVEQMIKWAKFREDQKNNKDFSQEFDQKSDEELYALVSLEFLWVIIKKYNILKKFNRQLLIEAHKRYIDPNCVDFKNQMENNCEEIVTIFKNKKLFLEKKKQAYH